MSRNPLWVRLRWRICALLRGVATRRIIALSGAFHEL
jgi:hypothetical protein